MINELAMLSEAIKEAGIAPEQWDPKYLPIPNIKANAPCIRIVLSEGRIIRLEAVSVETGKMIRKYGSNQSSFPAINLKPLYRITSNDQKKNIENALKGKTLVASSQARSWCNETYWSQKFRKKFNLCLNNTPIELQKIMKGSAFEEEFDILFYETRKIADPDLLHKALEDAAFQLLERKENTALALRVLFYLGNAEKEAQEDDSGALSVVFDCQSLIDRGIPVISENFTRRLNQALLSNDLVAEKSSAKGNADAFGVPFRPFEAPMPKIKLAGGFDTTLRTMFKEQHCQERYGKFEGDSYPISREKRLEFAAALDWLGKEENRNVTWFRTSAKYKTEANEILFVYPEHLPVIKETTSLLGMFTEVESNREQEFIKVAEAFISALSKEHNSAAESRPELIQIFFLRKIDKARTRVIYSRETNPYELDQRSRCWDRGKENLPRLIIGKPKTMRLLDAAEVMNRAWKRDGSQVNNFRQVPIYHGVEMFFGAPDQLASDLSKLILATEPAAPELMKRIRRRRNEELSSEHSDSEKVKEKEIQPLDRFIDMIRQAAALMGFILLELGSRKEYYMQEFAYLYGQLLNISDALHLLYCNIERKGQIPSQLAGGSLYMSVSEAPIRAMGILSDRMMPYINWAKAYRAKNIQDKNVESWRAGWLLRLYSENAERLYKALEEYHGGQFTDMEKAQFFLGYISSLAREENRDNLEQNTTEIGGKEND